MHDARVVFGGVHEVVDEVGGDALSAVGFSYVQADEVWKVCFGVGDVTVFVVGVCDEDPGADCVGAGW